MLRKGTCQLFIVMKYFDVISGYTVKKIVGFADADEDRFCWRRTMCCIWMQRSKRPLREWQLAGMLWMA